MELKRMTKWLNKEYDYLKEALKSKRLIYRKVNG
jgi:hypothetical protein